MSEEKIKEILERVEGRIINIENMLAGRSSDTGKPQKGKELGNKIDLERGMSELATNCNITVEELKNVISIKDNKVELICPINIKNESKKQNTATRCILITNEIVFKNEWTKTPELKEALREIGIQDNGGNLATNLKRHTELFRIRGKNIGTEYKLTSTEGRISSYEIIRKLAKNESLD